MSSEGFWAGQNFNITEVFLPIVTAFLILLPVLLTLFALGLLRHYRLWRLGKPGPPLDQVWLRLKLVLAAVFGQRRTLREFYPGLMHFLIFWGSLLLIFGKITRVFSLAVELTSPPRSIFLYASFISEVGGAMVILGTGMAVYRRYIARPSRLDTKPDDTLILLWGFLLLLTGYWVKGYRIAASGAGIPSDWMAWAPISFPFSQLMLTFSEEAKTELLLWHRTVIHALPAFVFLAYFTLSRSRLQHIWLSALNVFCRSLRPKGVLPLIHFETAQTYGAGSIGDFQQKQLMDLDACTRCGRCQDNCPAHLSGKTLSPKKMIQNLKAHMMEWSAPLFGGWRSLPMPFNPAPRTLLGEIVSREELWDCTTCGACEESCPVFVEQVDKNIEMRRNQVLTGQKLLDSVQNTLRNMEIRGNPWRGTEFTRDDWTKGLEIKILSPNCQAEWLFWVGCTGALVERNIQVTIALAKAMKAAGIDFGILGAAEVCCGDPARRVGHELQFQLMAQQNIETLKSCGVKKIVTHCPHCFETLKNEYPQLNGNFEVFHHTELIRRWLSDKKITLPKAMDTVVTYHDSCYLGRYNGIYDPPRDILNNIQGVRIVEMNASREGSFCCGGGGGHAWMEENVGRRINQMRLEQAILTNAQVIGVACPFCLQMFEDAIKGMESTLRAKDVIELVAEAINVSEKIDS
jgi:Fe-S oxidoreductase/nitrate reductase gamma subunit